MIPERVPLWDSATQVDICDWASRWMVSNILANRLSMMQRDLPYPLVIISGYRTPDEQQQLIDSDDHLAAPIDRSTHTACPATGADIWTDGVTPVTSVRAAVFAAASRVGLRVGGGGPVDPETGIPVDWNHVDLGPR